MKKSILILSIALCSTAMAQDLQQYVSVKGTIGRMDNKLTGDSQYNLYHPSTTAKPRPFNPIDAKNGDTTGGVRLAYGVIFPVANQQLRGELEYGYNGRSKLSDNYDYIISNTPIYANNPVNLGITSRIKSQFLMANLYYDFKNSSDFTPYVGAGLGYARLKANNTASLADNSISLSKSSNNFAWNLSVGVAYEISSNVALDVSYRYSDYGKVKTNGATDLSHTKLAGYDTTRTRSKVTSNEFNIGIRYTF